VDIVTLVLNSCQRLQPFSVRRLALKINVLASPEATDPPHLFFQHDRIQHLAVCGRAMGQILHNAVVLDGRVCKKLVGLWVELRDEKSLEKLIAFLKLCPNLKKLTIGGANQVKFPSEPLASDIVPKLQKYAGPGSSMDFIGQGRKVECRVYVARPPSRQLGREEVDSFSSQGT